MWNAVAIVPNAIPLITLLPKHTPVQCMCASACRGIGETHIQIPKTLTQRDAGALIDGASMYLA